MKKYRISVSLAGILTSGLLAASAIAQPTRYTVIDLGTLPGGTFSQAVQGNTDNGLIGGGATVADGTQHAVLWVGKRMLDLTPPATQGLNSLVGGLNAKGQAVGAAEGLVQDPNGEDFCGYGTGLECLPFLWEYGAMTPLPTLEGRNGAAIQINTRGVATGIVETAVRDASCFPPQVFDYEAVVWEPRRGIRELPPLPGDTVAVANWINDNGQVVGMSGSCANTLITGIVVGPHSVLWEADGSVHDLGTLGGSVNTAVPAVGNRALYINNLGQIVGGSTLPGNETSHAFLWTRESGIEDLGTLPGDFNSAAIGMNERGDIVGVSVDQGGDMRAFLRQHGVMTDLNTLVPDDTSLYLLFASGINNLGQIAGFGAASDGDVHAFLATPSQGEGTSVRTARPNFILSEKARRFLRQHKLAY